MPTSSKESKKSEPEIPKLKSLAILQKKYQKLYDQSNYIPEINSLKKTTDDMLQSLENSEKILTSYFNSKNYQESEKTSSSETTFLELMLKQDYDRSKISPYQRALDILAVFNTVITENKDSNEFKRNDDYLFEIQLLKIYLLKNSINEIKRIIFENQKKLNWLDEAKDAKKEFDQHNERYKELISSGDSVLENTIQKFDPLIQHMLKQLAETEILTLQQATASSHLYYPKELHNVFEQIKKLLTLARGQKDLLERYKTIYPTILKKYDNLIQEYLEKNKQHKINKPAIFYQILKLKSFLLKKTMEIYILTLQKASQKKSSVTESKTTLPKLKPQELSINVIPPSTQTTSSSPLPKIPDKGEQSSPRQTGKTTTLFPPVAPSSSSSASSSSNSSNTTLPKLPSMGNKSKS